MKRISILVAWLAVAAALAQEVGPAKGHLVIVGGGMRDEAILQRFFQLAGGLDAPVVLIPTASAAEDFDLDWRGFAMFRRIGAENLTVLHTRDREVADSQQFTAPLRQARGVFFTGGRQWRLVDAYMGTRTLDEIRNVLERGGVIGGSSAGATIQGSYLVRGDTETNTIMMGDHEEGFAFLKNVGIDQHLLRRNRHFDLIEVIRARPELLGIGIDENTALVVSGDRFEVIGKGYVAIYDAQKMIPPNGFFYFLAPGDHFDLKERQALRPVRTLQPLERVEEQPWPNNGGN